MTTSPLLDDQAAAVTGTPAADGAATGRDVDDEILEAPLPPITHRRRLGPLTFVLGLTVALAAGFLVGIVLEHRHDDAVAAETAANNPFAAIAAARGGTGTGNGTGTAGTGGGRGAGRGGGNANGGSAGASVQTGSVKLVDGNKLYVAMPDGSVAVYTVENDTEIARTVAAGTDALTPGQSVAVSPAGAPDADGVSKAGTITLGPAAAR